MKNVIHVEGYVSTNSDACVWATTDIVESCGMRTNDLATVE